MEVQKLEDLQQQLVEERERLSEKLEKHEIYQKFMQKVLDQSEEFSETREIIDRYNTLVATHSDLLDREQLNQVKFSTEKIFGRFSTPVTILLWSVKSPKIFRKHQKMRKQGWYDLLKKKITKYFTTIISSHNYKHVWIR